jgi:transcriptional regulator with XRE-family HTH domain
VPRRKTSTGFGRRLKDLREKAGLTQQQLADAAGLNKFGLAKLEQGVGEPHCPTVLTLAQALGVDCLAFTEPAGPGHDQPRGRGRPPKAQPAEDREKVPAPAKAKRRKRKGE